MMGSDTVGDEAIVNVGRAAPAPVKLADRKLIRAAQRGSADAVEALIRRYWYEATRIALVIVRDPAAAEDVAQESMMSAIQALDRFDRRRPFAPWLHRIVTNRSLDWIRSHDRRSEVEYRASIDDQRGAENDPSEISDRVLAAMGRLSPEDRAIVVMSHLFGYSAREIARGLDLKPGTVRSRLSRALARLRPTLAEVPKDSNQEAPDDE